MGFEKPLVLDECRTASQVRSTKMNGAPEVSFHEIDAIRRQRPSRGWNDVGGGETDLAATLRAMGHRAPQCIRTTEELGGRAHIAFAQQLADPGATDGAACFLQ